jgi:HAD superfamily hydrolase (TIGR01459 family)
VLQISGLGEVERKYSHFLVDLWGVVHDGHSLYPQAKEALEKLNKLEKQVIFFSNSPRRKLYIEAALHKMGVTENMYTDIITSGEVTRLYLQQNQKLGKYYFYIGSPVGDPHYNILAEMPPYQQVEKARDADFAVIATIIGMKEEEIQKSLRECLESGLTLLCVNPDKKSVVQDGSERICAGFYAEQYEDAGGKVIYIGKPFPQIYQLAFQMIGKVNNDVLAIGDSLAHDIQGANTHYLSSLWITGGIHKKDIISSSPEAVAKRLGTQPNYVCELLKW